MDDRTPTQVLDYYGSGLCANVAEAAWFYRDYDASDRLVELIEVTDTELTGRRLEVRLPKDGEGVVARIRNGGTDEWWSMPADVVQACVARLVTETGFVVEPDHSDDEYLPPSVGLDPETHDRDECGIADDGGDGTFVEITDDFGKTVALEKASLRVYDTEHGALHKYTATADAYDTDGYREPWDVDTRVYQDLSGAVGWHFDAEGFGGDLDTYLVSDDEGGNEDDEVDDGDESPTDELFG